MNDKILVKDIFVQDRYLVVTQAEIDAQARTWDCLVTASKLIRASSDDVVIVVHPNTQQADGDLLGVGDAELATLAREWDALARQAEEAGLIHAAASGYMVLVHPERQLSEGLYHKIQIATGNRGRLNEQT